ncbi:MAG: 50S ribosomal protein L23, partial [Candidatus Aminicenantes bacterium]
QENTVCFEVDRRANKIQVRHAVEQLFDVQVASVRMVNRKGKPIMRYGRVANHRPETRKAYVQLAPGSKNPEFFEGV